MKIIYTLFFVLVAIMQHVFAQPQTSRPNPVYNPNTGIFHELKALPVEPQGNVYLQDEWQSGSFILKPDVNFENYPIRYDIKNQYLEIKTGSEIKIAPLNKLKSFKFNGSKTEYVFKNAGEINHPGMTGVVQELVVGNFSLYVKPFIEVIPANYNVALDSGNKIESFETREAIILVSENDYHDITKSGKRVLKLFGSTEDDVDNYARRNKLSFKDKEDLIKIVTFYNSLLLNN
jgi:hypothetical protein